MADSSKSHEIDVSSPDKKRRKSVGKEEKEERKFPKEEVKPVSLTRVFAVHPQWGRIIVGGIGGICNGATLPLFSLFFGELFNNLGKDQSTVAKVSLLFFGLGCASFLCSYISITLFTQLGETITRDLRRLFFESLLRQEMGYFDVNETGSLTTRLASDTITIQNGISEKVGQLIFFSAQIIGGLVVAFVKGWKMTLVLIAISPLMVIGGALQTKFIMEGSKQSSESYEDAGEKAEEVISGFRTVISFNRQVTEVQKYDHMLVRVLGIGKKKAFAQGFGFGFSFFAIFAVYSLGFWYGGKLVYEGEMNAGDVLSVFFAIVIGGMGLGQMASLTPDFAKATSAAANIFHVIDRVPKVDAKEGKGRKAEDVFGEIALSKAKFSYPTRPDVEVLKGINLTIPAGKSVALVGKSGSGKSTIFSLIERFYDLTDGSLEIDGIDIQKYDLHELRKKIGIVQQEPMLFSSSIIDNIRYGNPNATDEQIYEAAKMANAHEFILGQPSGYDTKVGEKGTQLSGGQKQRIAIARAILKNPAILLLDEATSALDAESERLVKDALDKLMKGRTTLIIAHRLSTIKDADTIVVLRDGEIVQQGDHRELMKRGGAYKELVMKQIHLHAEGKTSSSVDLIASAGELSRSTVELEEENVNGHGNGNGIGNGNGKEKKPEKDASMEVVEEQR